MVDGWDAVAAEAVRDHGALQKPGELAGLLRRVAATGPKVIVEIGSDAGGTLWAWSQLPGPPRVIGVDLPGGPYGTGRQLSTHGAVMVIGDSHQYATRDLVEEQLAGDLADVLLIDGDHTYLGAKADWLGYKRIVRPGGLVVLHDIVPHAGRPDVGVHQLWREIAGQWPSEEIITQPEQAWAGVGVLTLSPREAPAPVLLAAR